MGKRKGCKIMNFRELAENAGLEKEEFLVLVGLFIETSLFDLRKLQSAIDKGDLQKMVEAAHSIKGAAMNLGFEDMYEVAEDIEIKAQKNVLEGTSGAVKYLQEKLDLISKDLGEPLL